MHCFGRNLEDHCCYVNGAPCKFLEENTEPNMRWSCGLRRETGSWAKAILDPRYFESADSPGQAFKRTPYKNCKEFQCPECAMLERGEITQQEFERLKAA